MKIHTLFTGVANTFIVENEHGVVVIDAGMPRQAQRILVKIRALGYAPTDLRLIAITHGHIDHAGSAVALKQLTGAPIAMHSADVRLTSTSSLKIPPGRTPPIDFIGRAVARMGFVVPLATFTPDVILHDQQWLSEFGFNARVIHTPGHTAGSVSLLVGDTVFVGDAMLNAVRVSFPLWWENATSARASACKINSLQPRLCYTAHGRPFDTDALAKFVSHNCAERNS
jgi:glyoxylase-like metal-dependent hydrolase (beta-lactamase superfamily II)